MQREERELCVPFPLTLWLSILQPLLPITQPYHCVCMRVKPVQNIRELAAYPHSPTPHLQHTYYLGRPNPAWK